MMCLAPSEIGGTVKGEAVGKRLAVLGAAVAVLALTISMIAPASSDQRYDRVSFTVWDTTADDEQNNIDIDVGEEGFGVGDYFVLSKDPFFNRSLTRQLGYFTGDCMFVALNEQTFEATIECDVTVNFRNGSTITAEGPVTFTEEAVTETTFAVTGGTGRYETAHGEVDATFDEDGGEFDFELLL
jgi:hypothetical protein